MAWACMYTPEEMHYGMGLSEDEIRDIMARNAVVMEEKGKALPTKTDDIDKFLNAMPLLAEQMPEPGKASGDFEALQKLMAEQLPAERANALKESGNMAYKLGKKDDYRYADAVIYYSQALDCKAEDPALNSTILANRSLAHIARKNWGRAFADGEAAVALVPTNHKAHYRAARAALELQRPKDALDHCVAALATDIGGEEKKTVEVLCSRARTAWAVEQAKAAAREEKRLKEEEERKREKELDEARKAVLTSECRKRGIRLGAVEYDYKEYVYRAGPDAVPKVIDEGGTHHVIYWPVIFLYPESQQSDFIASFSEKSSFMEHISQMFPPGSPYAPWDSKQKYRADNLRIYYESDSAKEKKKEARKPAKVSAAAGAGAGAGATSTGSSTSTGTSTGTASVERVGGEERARVFVNVNASLGSVLAKPSYIVPGIPIFHVIPHH